MVNRKSFSRFTIRHLLLLHLITPDAVNDFRVGALPAAEQLDGERKLDVGQVFVGVVELLVRDRAEVVLGERLLRLVAPEVLHEGFDERAVVRADVAVYARRRVLAKDGRARDDYFDRAARLLHLQPLELVGDERVAVAGLELRARGARRVGRGEDVAPDGLQKLQRAPLVNAARLRLRLRQLRAVDGEDAPLRAARPVRVRVDELDAGAREVCEVAYAFGVPLADEDDEGRLVDDAAEGHRLPVRRDEAALRQPVNVALDGEDADLRADALEDLIRDRLGAGVGGCELHFLAVLLLPLRGEAGQHALVHYFLHHREGVDGDAALAAGARTR